MLARTRKAFTLLELIVVIIILGIIALIAIPTYNQVVEKTREAAAKRGAEAVTRNAIALSRFDQSTPSVDLDTVTAGVQSYFDRAANSAVGDEFEVDGVTVSDESVVAGTSTVAAHDLATLTVEVDSKSYEVEVKATGNLVEILSVSGS